MITRCISFLALTALVACSSSGSPIGSTGEGGNTDPGGNGGVIKLDAGVNPTGGVGGSGTVVAKPGELLMAVRDFKLYKSGDSTTNPDFENVPQDGTNGPWSDLGIVKSTLGSDHKPEYGDHDKTLTTHGKDSFNQWFRDTNKINLRQDIPLQLVQNADGTWGYDSQTAGAPLSPGGMFFPIDDGSQYQTSFGNQSKTHNYSFTVEIHTVFTYQGGEHFFFSGDDDVFVFIDNKQVIDLGGIHSRLEKDVQIDSLGLTKGLTYPLDFFYCERHVTMSNLKITTGLTLTVNPDIPIY
jgi:fibro-slime domain-containing protein